MGATVEARPSLSVDIVMAVRRLHQHHQYLPLSALALIAIAKATGLALTPRQFSMYIKLRRQLFVIIATFCQRTLRRPPTAEEYHAASDPVMLHAFRQQCNVPMTLAHLHIINRIGASIVTFMQAAHVTIQTQPATVLRWMYEACQHHIASPTRTNAQTSLPTTLSAVTTTTTTPLPPTSRPLQKRRCSDTSVIQPGKRSKLHLDTAATADES